MDMIERVAMAMGKADRWRLCDNAPDWMADHPAWKPYAPLAHAAIEAMREPTDKMIQAGQLANNLLPDPPSPLAEYEYLTQREMKSAWQAMIDACLLP